MCQQGRKVRTTVTALRELAGQTRAALTARRDGPHQHTIADLIIRYSGAEFVNHSHWLVTNDKSTPDWMLSADNVQIGSANRREGDTNHRFADSCSGTFNILDADVVHTMENSGSHLW